MKSHEGTTPLTLAARRGKRLVCELLLESGADVDCARPGGWLPIQAAAYHDHCKTLRTLLDISQPQSLNAGVDEAKHYTALHFAIAHRAAPPEDILRKLLQLGSDVNAKNVNGATPLHLAALWNHMPAARLFIEAGAVLFAKNNAEQTPLDVLVKHHGVNKFSRYLAELVIPKRKKN